MLLKQLTAAGKKEYLEVLVNGYLQRVQVDLLDTDEEPTASLTDGPIALDGGEVSMNMTEGVTRTCTLSLVDEAHKMRYGKRGDHEYVMYVGRMVQVRWGVYLPKAGTWCDVPVFTGPITGFTVQGASVNIQAAGKEWLLLDPFIYFKTRDWKQGGHPTDMLRSMLQDRGEWNFRGFPPSPTDRVKNWSIARWESTWPSAQRLAFLSGRRVLYYAGDGACTLRKRESKPAWDFGTGQDVLGEPGFAYNFGDLRNFIQVNYIKDKEKATEPAQFGPPDPLAAKVLARNNVPLVMGELIDMSSAKTSQKEAKGIAQIALNDRGRTPVQVQFSALPVPHLEEYTTASITWDGFRYVFALQSFSLGLTPGGTMTVNIDSDQLKKRTKVP
jgi:hypothetical protein